MPPASTSPRLLRRPDAALHAIRVAWRSRSLLGLVHDGVEDRR